jgi:hypothetical protein
VYKNLKRAPLIRGDECEEHVDLIEDLFGYDPWPDDSEEDW